MATAVCRYNEGHITMSDTMAKTWLEPATSTRPRLTLKDKERARRADVAATTMVKLRRCQKGLQQRETLAKEAAAEITVYGTDIVDWFQ